MILSSWIACRVPVIGRLLSVLPKTAGNMSIIPDARHAPCKDLQPSRIASSNEHELQQSHQRVIKRKEHDIDCTNKVTQSRTHYPHRNPHLSVRYVVNLSIKPLH